MSYIYSDPINPKNLKEANSGKFNERMRDEVYYLRNVTFEVENCLFNIPSSAFEEGSENVSRMISETYGPDGNQTRPVELVGVTRVEFRRLLRVMYPLDVKPKSYNQVEWTSVLRLSTLWKLKDIREVAITELSILDMDPVEKITMSRAYNITGWLIPACHQLIIRTEALSLDETRKIGVDATTYVFQCRETLRSGVCSLDDFMHYVPSRVTTPTSVIPHEMQPMELTEMLPCTKAPISGQDDALDGQELMTSYLDANTFIPSGARKRVTMKDSHGREVDISKTRNESTSPASAITAEWLTFQAPKRSLVRLESPEAKLLRENIIKKDSQPMKREREKRIAFDDEEQKNSEDQGEKAAHEGTNSQKNCLEPSGFSDPPARLNASASAFTPSGAVSKHFTIKGTYEHDINLEATNMVNDALPAVGAPTLIGKSTLREEEHNSFRIQRLKPKILREEGLGFKEKEGHGDVELKVRQAKQQNSVKVQADGRVLRLGAVGGKDSVKQERLQKKEQCAATEFVAVAHDSGVLLKANGSVMENAEVGNELVESEARSRPISFLNKNASIFHFKAATIANIGPARGRRLGSGSPDDWFITQRSDTTVPFSSVLTTARIIEDINSIDYPIGIMRPKMELNVGVKNGKFRFDREFLLQFMHVCTVKPDTLPSLDTATNQWFHFISRDRSDLRVSSAILPPPYSRQASIGVGINPNSNGLFRPTVEPDDWRVIGPASRAPSRADTSSMYKPTIAGSSC